MATRARRQGSSPRLAADGVRLLAGAGRALAEAAGAEVGHVRDRSRSIGHCLRALGRTLRRRTGEARAEVLRLTGEAGDLLARTIGEARRMVGRVANETVPEIRAAREHLGGLVELAGRMAQREVADLALDPGRGHPELRTVGILPPMRPVDRMSVQAGTT